MELLKLEGKSLAAVRDIPDGASVVAFDGAVRSSKTVASLLLWVLLVVIRGPQGLLALCGRTETAVINNLVVPLQGMLGHKRVVLNRGLGIVTILGREHRIVGANDAQAVTKIQGSTLAGAYVDEAANVPEAFFNMLRSRLSVKGAMLFLTCNPDGPKHWLKVKWLDRARWSIDRDGHSRLRAKPDSLPWWRVTFVLDDNTWLARNNPAFVAELKASWPKASMFYRRYILSEWVSADGAVYDGWREESHTVDPALVPRPERILVASLDYGTTHRTRGYLLGVVRVRYMRGQPVWQPDKPADSERYALVVLDEFAPDTATVGQHAEAYEAWLTRCAETWGGNPEWIVVDPAAATFKAELYARGRSDVINAHNAVVPGIEVVASLLQAMRLFVAYKAGQDDAAAVGCSNLVDRLPSYMWDTKATERGETRPVKVDDDEVDALRYLVYTSRSMWRELVPLAATARDSERPTDDDGSAVA